jgi:uncharacterized membrane protein
MAESNLSGTNGFLSKWTDERVERILGTLLQTGVIISGIVVLIGGVLYAVRYGGMPVNYRTFDPERGTLRSFREVVQGTLNGDGRAIIQCGLLLLIATPVSRVIFSMIAFALEGDRLYVGLTLIVFVVLLYSLFGGVG